MLYPNADLTVGFDSENPMHWVLGFEFTNEVTCTVPCSFFRLKWLGAMVSAAMEMNDAIAGGIKV